LDQLKADIAEKDRLLAAAKEETARATALAQTSNQQPPKSDDEAKKLESKVKDLEARLAEYEIISEDIADLSFYKEENIRLQNELMALKNGEAPADAVVAAPEAAEAAPLTADGALAPDAAPPVAEVIPEAAPAAAEDDIMKEFAKAVEEQKAPTTEAPAAAKTDQTENADLMNQFENFVKKD
jgi:hypothetical protein